MSIAPDDMLMMLPDPCSIITRAADWQPKNTPLRFVARMRSRSASSGVDDQAVVDDARDVPHHVEAPVGGDRAEHQVFHVGARRRVAADRGGLAAFGEDLVGGLGRALEVDVGAHHGGPDPREHAGRSRRRCRCPRR